MVKKKIGKKLKCLRFENRGEYISREFETYCIKNGISHEKTVSSTLLHNGVAEKMNRTIIEKVKCMLKIVKLPKVFWGETTQIAYYLINKSPLGPLNFEVLEKAWTRKNVSYSFLRIFGGKTFVHVPK